MDRPRKFMFVFALTVGLNIHSASSLTVHSHNNKRISHSPIFPSQIAHPWIAAILNHPFYIFTYYPGLRPLSGPNKEGENEVKGNTPLYVVHTGSNHFMSLVSVFPDIDAN
jgi:hypothetical protein